nr:exodeoxyribonuclease VII small subunit [uncultured Halomonas sp.]
MADQKDTAEDGAQDERPGDFAATLERLEALVNQLESGDLSLEASLAAFEQGVTLTREAQRRLGEAELKVQTLVEQPDGSIDEIPFDDASSAASNSPTTPWEVRDDLGNR